MIKNPEADIRTYPGCDFDKQGKRLKLLLTNEEEAIKKYFEVKK